LSRFLAAAQAAGVVAGVVLVLASEAGAGSGVASLGSVGIIAGQSIRVSVINPAPAGAPTPLPVVARIRILDSNGNVLATSPQVTVGPGQTRTYVVRRSALSAPGEPGTGRLQLRAETELVVASQPAGDSQVVVTNATITTESTGAESGMIGDIRTVISAEAN
jgi:hypothetical protein